MTCYGMYMFLTRRAGPALAALMGLISPATACSVALAFAVDVSASVTPAQYRLQMDGLAQALRDPVVTRELAGGQAALTLVQWTGRGFQQVAIPWRQVTRGAEVEAFARTVAATPRAWPGANTALGEALAYTHAHFAGAPACARQIIDVSGNGRSNEGRAPRAQRAGFDAAGFTVNAIVLQRPGTALDTYFLEEVIAGPGAFVVTVARPEDYPDRMREKLLRELAVQMVRHP